MNLESQTIYEQFLESHDAAEWSRAVAQLRPSIHEVDRSATAIWFAFYPLPLWSALEQAEDEAKLAQKLLLRGEYRLDAQIDSSHAFLYGHRFWPQVKKALAERAAQSDGGPEQLSLMGEIERLAKQAAGGATAQESLLIGISAVALMTLRQVGLAAFAAAPGTTYLDAKKSPEQILRERARDDSQGLLGSLLRTTDKRWTVTWDEGDEAARFGMIDRQEIASAAATDKRDWSLVDERCTINEGRIPVQCRSASCGTCWIGVLGGAEKLSEVSPRERRQLREFGYLDTAEARPLVRLACQAQGRGAVSIVIPPWNGVFGKYLDGAQSSSPDAQIPPDGMQASD